VDLPGSDCMFFGSLIGTYLAYKGKTSRARPARRVQHPAHLVERGRAARLLAHHGAGPRRAAGDDLTWAARWLFATALLGAHFVRNQVYEFTTFASTTAHPRHQSLRSSFFTSHRVPRAHVTGG
jgi:heme/copper-type cytochrome/quinol oxidase subunit 3